MDAIGYSHLHETFYAYQGDQVFGTQPQEHLTPDSLIDAVERSGLALEPGDQARLDELSDTIRSSSGDFSIVGVDSRLFTVSPTGNAIREISSDGRYSPDGFSWGYDGAGPRQTASAILNVTHGQTAAAEHQRVEHFTEDVVSRIPSQHSTFEITGDTATRSVPDVALSSDRIDAVIRQLDNISPRTQTEPAPSLHHTPASNSTLFFSYRPQSETYEAAAISNDPTHPTTSYGHEPGSTPTPESLLSQLAADGHRPSPDQLRSIAELQTQVRARHGEHTIIGHTNQTDGQRHLHLITPNNQAHRIEPTGAHSPDGYNWGYHGSGTNETAEQIANTVLGPNHPDRPQLTSALRESLANVTTDNFTLNASDAAKLSHPLDITQRPHLGMEHVKSIATASPSRPAPTGPTLGIRI